MSSPKHLLTAQGFIYFVQVIEPRKRKQTGPIKIGWATEPEKRFDDLKTTCPYPIFVMGTVAGTRLDEKALHRRFHASRLRGEWFEATAELLAHVQETTKRQRPDWPFTEPPRIGRRRYGERARLEQSMRTEEDERRRIDGLRSAVRALE